MTRRTTNAQLIGQTRLCVAQCCPNDAETNHPLCSRCQKRQRDGRPIILHTEPPEPSPTDHPEDTLKCSRCKRFLPDDDFGHKQGSAGRRYRRSECRACSATRRREDRKTWTPDIRALETLLAKQRRHAAKRRELERLRQERDA